MPMTGYRRADGKVSFKLAEGYPERPVTVACGQCRGCRLERSRQWVVRCMHEAQMHETNSFVTFTYDEEHLVPGGSLNKSHFTKFMKRLRWTCGTTRFYQCGEYGEPPKVMPNGKISKGFRPHHHSLIFGLDFHDDRKFLQHNAQGDKIYESEMLDELWSHGKTYIGDITPRSASYVARYTLKQLHRERGDEVAIKVDVNTGEITELVPEYSTMSRRPGIGASWLAKYKTDVFPNDYVVHDGYKSRPPQFYDYCLEAENPELLKQLKNTRVKNAKKHRENNTPERLAVREKVKEAQLTQLKRSQH